MKINEMQFASLTISLSTLGQVSLEGNTKDNLQLLEFLLERALSNVRLFMTPIEPPPDDEPPFDDSKPT